MKEKPLISTQHHIADSLTVFFWGFLNDVQTTSSDMKPGTPKHSRASGGGHQSSWRWAKHPVFFVWYEVCEC